MQRKKLISAGFLTVEDVIELKPSELSKELSVTKEEALDLLRVVKDETKKATGPAASQSITALEMLKDEQSQQCIITFSEQLDRLLGGGVPLTKITEFSGAPGVGKTQVSMQLSVDVSIPECFGGLGSEAVYIDTEGSFMVDRVMDIAKATVAHCKDIAQAERNQEQVQRMKTYTAESVLDGVHYFRCHDYVELVACVNLLPNFIKDHPKVKLAVVDSIAFHFRHDFEDWSLRTRLLNGMAQSFIKLATEAKLAVVLTNQMTTKINREKGGHSQLIPALGESWGHAPTIRVILHWRGNQRYATLYKSPSRQEATVPYQVTPAGVRDVFTNQPDPPEEEESPSSKRQRTA